MKQSIVVPKSNQYGFSAHSWPVSGMTNPLYDAFFLPGYDLTSGSDPIRVHFPVSWE